METSIKALAVVEIETLANEIQQRMGRGMTRVESFYLIVATACTREGCEFPDGLIERQMRPS